MPTTVTLTDVLKPAGGRIYINFADGTQLEFNSLADVQAWATEADLNRTLVQQFCVAFAMARSADLNNIAIVKNKNFTLDLSDNAPIKVQ